MRWPNGAKLPTKDRVQGVFQDLKLGGKIIHLDALPEVELTVKDDAVGVFKGYASTGAKNSHGFRIPPVAWKDPAALERFLTNPIVNFSHDPKLLIGNATLTDPRDKGLYTEIEYERQAVLPTQLKLGDMVDRGRIKALSAEINILRVELIEAGDEIDILVYPTLLALAMCGVPSDPGALTEVNNEFTEFVSLCLTDQKIQVGGFKMDPKLIRKLLGLAEDATDEQVMARQNELTLAADSHKKLAVSLGLSESASLAEIQTKLTEQGTTNKTLAEQVKRNTAKDLVREHKEKIAPSLMPWAEELAYKDEAAFLAFVKAAPAGGTPPPQDQIIPTEGGRTVLKFHGKSKTLTTDDVDVMKKLGYFRNPEEMEKMAEVTPDEALSWFFPSQHFSLTKRDQETIDKRRELDAICGIAV